MLALFALAWYVPFGLGALPGNDALRSPLVQELAEHRAGVPDAYPRPRYIADPRTVTASRSLDARAHGSQATGPGEFSRDYLGERPEPYSRR